MERLVRVVGWVVIGTVTITFGVTILALLRKDTIQEPYLGRLFGALIVELVSAFFFLFHVGVRDENRSRMLAEFKSIIAEQDGVAVEEITLQYVQHRQIATALACHACSRDYAAAIYWYSRYAVLLLNHDGSNAKFKALNPRSEGHLHYYKSPAGVYKGYSTWTVKNGEQDLSQLVVIPSEFEFDGSGNLKFFCVKIAFRKKLTEFSYGPFTHYHLRFYERSDTRLRGKIFLVQNGDGAEEIEVGDVGMELE